MMFVSKGVLDMIRTIMASAALAVLSAGSASAYVLTFAPTPAPFSSAIATLIAGPTIGNNVTTSLDGQRLSPWGADGDPFSFVVGEAEYNFDGVSTFFSLVWGSPDAYNTLKFFNDATLVDEVDGTEFPGYFPLSGNLPNSFVSITGLNLFNRVVFSSKNPSPESTFYESAFEWAVVSNVPTIPLPAGGLLLLSGLAGVAALRRRKSV